MKLKYEFVYHPVGEHYIGVAVGDNASHFNATLQLDEVSYDIITHITDNISREELIDQMLTIYDDERDIVAKYVDKVIDYLKENDILSC